MSRSSDLLEASRLVIPGGVNSPVRAFSAVEGDPPFIARGEGVRIHDEDGNSYYDLVGSWGPLILGHAHPKVVAAVAAALAKGASFGAPTKGELHFAQALVERVPGIDMVRLCSSGTEATMHALRLARGFTGRDAIIKIDGCYHGAHDTVLVSAGSGVATYAKPGSPGIIAPATLTAPFNDLPAIEAQLSTHALAAVIVEPVPGNMGCIPPDEGYLQGLRELCTSHGALLIFDEVMTGFRLARGGAQEHFGVTADVVCMGKIVGGGLPLAAFGARREIMENLSPLGPVYQAGTLSGNPLAVAAGLATLAELTDEAYQHLDDIARGLHERLLPHIEEHSLSMSRVGTMLTVFFRSEAPKNFEQVKECDLAAFGRFHRACLDAGVYLPCSQFEAVFLPLGLGQSDLDEIAGAMGAAMGVARA
ncbi:MAG TPA: glutamate-1-semialdehyde 2,1-aminomutase [Myxococcota bacterium]|nr:glutamate-1-semialdehyde 2,1-aminomutase [Myxococcota bacterium]